MVRNAPAVEIFVFFIQANTNIHIIQNVLCGWKFGFIGSINASVQNFFSLGSALCNKAFSSPITTGSKNVSHIQPPSLANFPAFITQITFSKLIPNLAGNVLDFIIDADIIPDFFCLRSGARFINVIEPLGNDFVRIFWKCKALFVLITGNVRAKPVVKGVFTHRLLTLFQFLGFDTAKDGGDCADFLVKARIAGATGIFITHSHS
nr:MAG TPA: hypothetical protein [Caudoviricetes sp.]